MIKKCVGCGVELQCIDANKLGYIPQEKYDNSNYCQRCFKLIHYNKKVNNKANFNNDEIIESINKDDAYVYFLVDLFNINSEIINTFKSIKLKKMLVINKSDLIPRSISITYLKERIMSIYDIKNIRFASLKIEDEFLINNLQKNNYKKCYIVGYTNAGKSSLINKLTNNKTITTSNMPNTTIDFIDIKFNDIDLIDTPGFVLKNNIYNNDDWNLIKRINASHYIKPITYQTKDNQIFNIEEKIFITDFGHNSITLYLSNLINLKKQYKLNEMEYQIIHVNNNSDLIINNIGFINIKEECNIKINKDAVKLIEIRESLFGGNNYE